MQLKNDSYTIETIHRLELSFDADDWDSVSDGLLRMGRKLDSCEVFTGGAACFPYVTAEHKSAAPLRHYAEKCVRYIGRRKGGRII